VVVHLKQQAGWNQSEADLQRIHALQPDGCFVAELDGVPAGTVTTCVFGPVGWIAMMLVEASLRGRGIGRALMDRALRFLEQHGVRTVRLDATPLGQPLYEKLGFVAEYQLARFGGTLPGSGERGPPHTAPQTEPLVPGSPLLASLLQLDQTVTRADRAKLLVRLFTERPEAVRLVVRDGQVAGFLTARPGSRAVQIGPCIARPEAGPLLLTDAFHCYAGQFVYIDIPVLHTAAGALAVASGLTVQRHLLRMSRGEPVQERFLELWASSGPEKG
jgi:hypothetical protein